MQLCVFTRFCSTVYSVAGKLTGDKELCVCLSLPCRAASTALEYSSVSQLDPPYCQPGGCVDSVAGIGQFGQRDGVLIPFYPGLGNTWTWKTGRGWAFLCCFFCLKLRQLTLNNTFLPENVFCLIQFHSINMHAAIMNVIIYWLESVGGEKKVAWKHAGREMGRNRESTASTRLTKHAAYDSRTWLCLDLLHLCVWL